MATRGEKKWEKMPISRGNQLLLLLFRPFGSYLAAAAAFFLFLSILASFRLNYGHEIVEEADK